MINFIIRRILVAFVLMFLISVISFFIITLTPGSPYPWGDLNPKISAAVKANFRKQFHLDDPLWKQYVNNMHDLFTGQLVSIKDGRPVLTRIGETLPATLALNFTSIVISLSFGLVIGVWSARTARRWPDTALSIFTFALLALPSFWVSYLVIIWLTRWFGTPILGTHSFGVDFPNAFSEFLDYAWHLALPATILALGGIAMQSRYVRASMLESFSEDYIRTARAKGLDERTVSYKHALRNSLRPLITGIGLLLPALLGGSVIIEAIFAYPGIGRLGLPGGDGARLPASRCAQFHYRRARARGQPHRRRALRDRRSTCPPRMSTGDLSPGRRMIRRFFRDPVGNISFWVIVVFFVVALVFWIFSVTGVNFPMNPDATNVSRKLMAPNAVNWLGTDNLGRDVLTRMLHGSYISLTVGFVAVAVSLLIGVVVGAVSGFFGGWIDNVLMRIVDSIMCFPTFFLILSAVAIVGPSLLNVIIVIGLVSWTGTARLVRAEFLTLRESQYVIAAKNLGQRAFPIIFRHILPNAAAPIFVTAVLGIPDAILTEAGLSYLGFGVQPPTPTWGNIIADGRSYILDAWWLILFPGLAIFFAALAFFLAGDALRRSAGSKAETR